VRANRPESLISQFAAGPQAFDFRSFYQNRALAHNLNVALQPAAMDARWLSSKMDFRSNEAGRTAPQESRLISSRSESVPR
jgi:hypothetical protein